MPAIPAPITHDTGKMSIEVYCRGSRSEALMTLMRTRSLALAVAASHSCMWTQEHWSRMLANSNRYLLSPASSHAARNKGSCVRGVQDATTTLLRSCSLMACLMAVSYTHLTLPTNREV